MRTGALDPGVDAECALRRTRDQPGRSFLLSPRVSIVPKLVAEMEAIRTEAGVTLEDRLSGLPEMRRQLSEESQRRDD